MDRINRIVGIERSPAESISPKANKIPTILQILSEKIKIESRPFSFDLLKFNLSRIRMPRTTDNLQSFDFLPNGDLDIDLSP